MVILRARKLRNKAIRILNIQHISRILGIKSTCKLYIQRISYYFNTTTPCLGFKSYFDTFAHFIEKYALTSFCRDKSLFGQISEIHHYFHFLCS